MSDEGKYQYKETQDSTTFIFFSHIIRWIGSSLLKCNTGFVRGLKNLKSFGNLNLLVPGLEILEIWENPIKSHGYWHFGHGDFILVPGLEILEIWENPIKSHGYWHFGHGDFIFIMSQMFI
jgi:hypothetical protein